MKEMIIRKMGEDDYELAASIFHAANADAEGRPMLTTSAEELRLFDQDRPGHIRAGQWLAEVDGQVAGACNYEQNMYRYQPQNFWVDIYVHPQKQRQGIGSALYAHLMEALAPLDPRVLRCNVREDMPASRRFLERRGFAEEGRKWESLLEVETFDPAPHSAVFGRLAEQGISIHTLAELSGDPQRDQKLYELVWEYRQDMPDREPAQPEPFDSWRKHTLENPDLIPEAFFIATRGVEYAGASYYYLYGLPPSSGNQPAAAAARTSFRLRLAQTGVKRAYRGRGIALALRLRGAEYARLHGYTTIRTVNDGENEPMLRLNRRMGFRALPAWLEMVKRLGG